VDIDIKRGRPFEEVYVWKNEASEIIAGTINLGEPIELHSIRITKEG